MRYCARLGVSPVVMDTRAQPPGAEQLPAGLECHFGGLDAEVLLSAELIIASPGVPLATPSCVAPPRPGWKSSVMSSCSCEHAVPR
ncbi:hypothetical protein MBH78_09635 [Oceanimonas sp. NS1]|nr:hypothetical protein [Oceanimonas sp. NS1]